MVGLFIDLTISINIKFVIILGAESLRCRKAISDLKAFYRADGHDGTGQPCIQLIKDRLTNAGRHAIYQALYHTAHGILGCDHALQKFCRLFCRYFIRHIQAVVVPLG